MEKRSVATPWRRLGGWVALLAGLMVVRPAWAGEFFLEGEGTPDLQLTLTTSKLTVVPSEAIPYKLVVHNSGDGTAINTVVKLIFILHADYVPGSTTWNGLPVPDAIDGNPFLRGVAIGDLEPNDEAVLTFSLQAMPTVDPTSPIKVRALAINDVTGATPPTPVLLTPIVPGTSKIEFEKLGDLVMASPRDPITYRLVVRNTGNGTALDVRLQDSIPSYTHYVPASTTVNGNPIPDQIGGCPLEAGLSLGDLPAGGDPVTVSMKVLVNDSAPYGAFIRNTARVGDHGTPETPSNTVTTTVVDTPRVTTTGTSPVPNLIETVPTTGRGIVIGTPTDVTVCDQDCQPTTAKIHVSTDITHGIANTWLQVVGLDGSGGASIEPSLGVTLSERLSREGLIAPGIDTVFQATFPDPGGQVSVNLSLTPKALQMVMLDQIMRRIASQAGIAAPTAAQVLAMYRKAGSIPTLKAVLEHFGPYPSVPPVLEAGDTVPTLQPPSPAQLEELTFELQGATQDLAGLLYFPAEMDAFREALQAVMGYSFSNAQIRPVAQSIGDSDPGIDALRDELSLVISTRTNPIKLSFIAQRIAR